MLNPHGWKDYRYRMLYTDRVHFIHANVTSTTTACLRRRTRREESPRCSAQPRLRTPDTRLRLRIPEAQRGKGEGHVWGKCYLYTHQNKQKNPCKSMTKMVCVLSLESSQFPLVFSLVSCFSPTGPEGMFPSGEGGWWSEIRTLAFLSFPHPLLCFSPATLAFPVLTRPGCLRIHPPWGPVGGRERWERAWWLSAALVGRVAERALLPGSWPGPLPRDGSCWLWGPA